MARGQNVANEHSEKAWTPPMHTGQLNPGLGIATPLVGERGTRKKKKRIRGACGECAHQKYPVSAQAVARGAAYCASQVLDRDAQAVARGAARCASQVLDCCAQAAAS
jgi:hypothetical protein